MNILDIRVSFPKRREEDASLDIEKSLGKSKYCAIAPT